MGGKENATQRRSGRAPPPSSKKSRTRLYAVSVVVVIAIIAVAAIAFSSPSGTGNGGGDNGTVATWTPLQGQYLDYVLKTNGSTYGTERMLVLSVSSTIRLNVTTHVGNNVTQQDQELNSGQAVGPSCEHYHASVLNQGTTGNVTMDFFLYANIMVRMEGNDGVSTFSMLLTGTNIPVIVNG